MFSRILKWWRTTRKFAAIARHEAGSRYQQHRHEIKWQVRLHVGAVLNGFDDMCQGGMLRRNVARICGGGP